MKLTDLSARQIRYYEEQELVNAALDCDKLLEIKDYLADGYNMASIKKVYAQKAARRRTASRKDGSIFVR